MTTHTSHDSGHGPADTAHGHAHGGTGLYVKVFLALCFLTGVSIFAFWSLKATPAVAWVVMMAVSCTKALLVMTFFMHLLWEANWKYVLTIPASMMSIFLIIALVPDVGQRTRTYSEEREIYAAEPQSASDHELADEHHDESEPKPTSQESAEHE